MQPKLTVGASDDRYEREADEIADRVTSLLSQGDTGNVSRVHTPLAGRIARIATIGSEGGDVDADTESQISRARSGGKPLEAGIRRSMEGAFGADFGRIRMHVGPQSDALNERIQARAFTTGSDVFVRRQDYAPNTAAGQKLLAHELAHTVQQGGASVDGSAQRSIQRSSQTIQRWSLFSSSATKGKGAAKKTTVDSDVHGDVNAHGETITAGLGGTQVSDIDSYKDDLAKAKSGDKDAVGSGKSGASDKESQQLGVVGGSADFATMFVGLSKAVKGFRDGKTNGDKFGAVLEGVAATTTGAKGLGNMIKSGSELDGHKDGIGSSKDAAGALGGIADSFGAIKDTFFAIKKIVDLASEAAGMSDQEKFKASMDIIKTSLEAVKGGLSAVKTFLDLANSGVSAAMVNAIPGLGIAIGCAELIVRSVDLVTSMVRSSDMRKSKQAAKTLLGGVKGTSMEAQAKAKLLTGNADEKAAAEEYLTAKGLQYVNDKNSRRALLKIGVAMAKIAGDAATLGGASAPVGIGLKVGAVVLDLGATVFRKFKQWARDKAAAQEDAGTPGILSKIFNTDKSTTKKLVEYNRMLDNVFSMIIAATPAADPATDAETVKMKKAEGYVVAMGFSMVAMQREAAKDTTGDNLRAKMIESMQKRE